MKTTRCALFAFVCIASSQAQSLGVAVDFGIPMGEFSETKFAPSPGATATETEGYDPGFGLRGTISFPFAKKLALRAGLGVLSNKGTLASPGYENIFLRHTATSLSGELQIFFDNAYEHEGLYLMGGISANFERFEQSYDKSAWDTEAEKRLLKDTKETRMGATIGMGYTFGSGGGPTLEIAYHATLSAKDVADPGTIAANYLRLSVGFVF